MARPEVFPLEVRRVRPGLDASVIPGADSREVAGETLPTDFFFLRSFCRPPGVPGSGTGGDPLSAVTVGSPATATGTVSDSNPLAPC